MALKGGDIGHAILLTTELVKGLLFYVTGYFSTQLSLKLLLQNAFIQMEQNWLQFLSHF